MPLDKLESNGMYLVVASLAWTLNSWLALWLVEGRKQEEKCCIVEGGVCDVLQAIVMTLSQISRSNTKSPN